MLVGPGYSGTVEPVGPGYSGIVALDDLGCLSTAGLVGPGYSCTVDFGNWSTVVAVDFGYSSIVNFV